MSALTDISPEQAAFLARFNAPPKPISAQSLFGGGMMSGGGGPGLLPGTSNKYDPATGGVPNVPNPGTTAGHAITENLANLPNIAQLTQGLDTASGAGVMAALAQEIPGIQGLIGGATNTLNEFNSGQVPQDVIDQIAQGSAEIGAGRGMGPMSPFSNANYLRSLGLTSLGMKEKGLSGTNALMGSVPRAPTFDPSSMTVTPRDQQEAEYMAEVMANAPVPAAAAKANLAALNAGAGFRPPGVGGPVGGFNVPIHGGPAFPDVPTAAAMTGFNPDATTAVLGATGPTGADSVGSFYQTPQAYDNWNKLAATWAMSPTGNQYPTEYDPEIDAMNQNIISDIPAEPIYPDDQYAQQWQDFYDMGGI